jgi:hypothetical protein
VGGEHSAAYRAALLRELQLPRYLSANRMIEVLNAVLTEENYQKLLEKVTKQTQPLQKTCRRIDIFEK